MVRRRGGLAREARRQGSKKAGQAELLPQLSPPKKREMKLIDISSDIKSVLFKSYRRVKGWDTWAADT